MTNGKWYLRSEGYMKPDCDYQEIMHLKSNRAIEHGDRLVFAKKDGDGNVLDERVYLRPRHVGTQWEKLFGTPERAARTLVERLDVGVIEWCNNECDNCPYEFDPYGCEQVLTLLEWLESEGGDD